MDTVSTGKRIQARREKLGISRKALAETLETTRMTVWRIENGKTQLKAELLKTIAKKLRTSPAELLA